LLDELLGDGALAHAGDESKQQRDLDASARGRAGKPRKINAADRYFQDPEVWPID
jgi:hypothetical protein